MKGLALFLGTLFLILQYKLWFASGGIAEAWNLHQTVNTRLQQNQVLRERNSVLAAEVENLKRGTSAIEERARSELGMVRQGEDFYQIVK